MDSRYKTYILLLFLISEIYDHKLAVRMEFQVRTLRSEQRHFLVDVRHRPQSPDVSPEKVHQQILALFLRLFGSAVTSPLDLTVSNHSHSRVICSVRNEFAVAFRCAIALPPIPLAGNSDIEGFHVIAETSFLQALFHISRIDFPPLT
jgi:hypothetical protein